MTWAHERPFEPVHDRLPFQAITDRPSPPWPGGARLAVWIVPNVEHYEYLPPVGAQDPYPRTPHPDVRKFSYHDYGNRAGFWRMLEVLDRWQIPCTTSLNVAVLDHYPEVAEAMVARGWEFMSHGLYNTRYLTGLSEDEERAFLAEVDELLFARTGRHFAGMLGPNISGNPWTPDLMAERGMTYHADWVHDERPAPLRTRSGRRLVALPYTYSLNDAPLLMRSHRERDAYTRMCTDQFDELCEGREHVGRLMCLSLHPFAIGQPHRVDALDAVLAHLRSRDDVWIATGSQIAEHYLATAYDDDLALATAGGAA
jgi:peptidoglycan/xylan/chitin deacetylase (PgdA/CDA1 family)